ncbi:hypothetical protein FRC03_012107 [Tulasnella sp. 419]|nr:hypothetical protein FRC03_012107 [Tulasnella sp. 419]
MDYQPSKTRCLSEIRGPVSEKEEEGDWFRFLDPTWEVCRGRWCPPGSSETDVVIKTFNWWRPGHTELSQSAIEESELKVNEWLEHNVSNWKQLSHRLIVPCHGFQAGLNPRLILPFYANGNLISWQGQNPDADKTRILADVAEALVYLHSRGIVHGSLRRKHVLISDQQEALLRPIGFHKITAALDSFQFYPFHTPSYGYLGLQSPENFLLYGEGGIGKPPSDVYAFGGFIVEVFSGRPPFWNLRRHRVRIRQLILEEHQTCPREECPGVPDWAWDLAMRCWTAWPENRPKMTEVLATIKSQL